MKKRAIIALIVAAVLILVGSTILVLGLSYAGEATVMEPAKKTYVVNDAFQSIQIDSGICDITLVKTDGDFRAVCPDSEKISCAVLVEDGVLKVNAVDIRHWTDMIGINIGEMEMIVYLPESRYDSLHIETDTGDIEIPQDFSFDSVSLLTSTGDIDFAAAVVQSLTLSNSTGDIHVQDTSPTFMDSRLSTGDILLENLPDCGDVRLRSSTGAILAIDTTCENLTCSSSTGDTHLTGVLVEESLQITSTTGNVIIESSDAGFISIETDTGDVTGNFLSPKWFITDTDTGDISVPLSREGGECRITTNTGDVRFQ